MTFYLKQGTFFKPTKEEHVNIVPQLPAGNYVIQKDGMTGQLFLESADSFLMPKKVYGRAPALAERILSTYKDRTQSTGVLLTGERVLARRCLRARFRCLVHRLACQLFSSRSRMQDSLSQRSCR